MTQMIRILLIVCSILIVAAACAGPSNNPKPNQTASLPMQPPRLNYSESCSFLLKNGYEFACHYLLANGQLKSDLKVPQRMPLPDDEIPDGVEFFRTKLGGENGHRELLENLTIPGMFICRSELSHLSMKNTDLSGSFICWNDIVDVNFEDSDLQSCDFRCNLIKTVSFKRANLSHADLRHCTIEDCDFSGALMKACKIPTRIFPSLRLSVEQRADATVSDDEGPEAPGG
jgi:hypothetical protein